MSDLKFLDLPYACIHDEKSGDEPQQFDRQRKNSFKRDNTFFTKVSDLIKSDSAKGVAMITAMDTRISLEELILNDRAEDLMSIDTNVNECRFDTDTESETEEEVFGAAEDSKSIALSAMQSVERMRRSFFTRGYPIMSPITNEADLMARAYQECSMNSRPDTLLENLYAASVVADSLCRHAKEGCSCEAYKAKRETFEEELQVAVTFQYLWMEFRQHVRATFDCLLEAPANAIQAGDEKFRASIPRKSSAVPDARDTALWLCRINSHRLFMRLVSQTQELVIEIKVRLLSLLEDSDINDLTTCFLTGLLNDYDALISTTLEISDLMKALKKRLYKLYKANFTWDCFAKKLYQIYVYSDPLVQNNLPAFIASLRKSLPFKGPDYRALVRRYLAFNIEMIRIANLWTETKPWMDRYNAAQALRTTRIQKIHDACELFTSSHQTAENLILSANDSHEEKSSSSELRGSNASKSVLPVQCQEVVASESHSRSPSPDFCLGALDARPSGNSDIQSLLRGWNKTQNQSATMPTDTCVISGSSNRHTNRERKLASAPYPEPDSHAKRLSDCSTSEPSESDSLSLTSSDRSASETSEPNALDATAKDNGSNSSLPDAKSRRSFADVNTAMSANGEDLEFKFVDSQPCTCVYKHAKEISEKKNEGWDSPPCSCLLTFKRRWDTCPCLTNESEMDVPPVRDRSCQESRPALPSPRVTNSAEELKQSAPLKTESTQTQTTRELNTVAPPSTLITGSDHPSSTLKDTVKDSRQSKQRNQPDRHVVHACQKPAKVQQTERILSTDLNPTSDQRDSSDPTNNHGNSCPTSGSGHKDSSRRCSCCYCEVFGRSAPSVTPVTRNYNEMRARLRQLLTERKRKTRNSKASISPLTNSLSIGSKNTGVVEMVSVVDTVGGSKGMGSAAADIDADADTDTDTDTDTETDTDADVHADIDDANIFTGSGTSTGTSSGIGISIGTSTGTDSGTNTATGTPSGTGTGTGTAVTGTGTRTGTGNRVRIGIRADTGSNVGARVSVSSGVRAGANSASGAAVAKGGVTSTGCGTTGSSTSSNGIIVTEKSQHDHRDLEELLEFIEGSQTVVKKENNKKAEKKARQKQRKLEEKLKKDKQEAERQKLIELQKKTPEVTITVVDPQKPVPQRFVPRCNLPEVSILPTSPPLTTLTCVKLSNNKKKDKQEQSHNGVVNNSANSRSATLTASTNGHSSVSSNCISVNTDNRKNSKIVSSSDCILVRKASAATVNASTKNKAGGSNKSCTTSSQTTGKLATKNDKTGIAHNTKKSTNNAINSVSNNRNKSSKSEITTSNSAPSLNMGANHLATVKDFPSVKLTDTKFTKKEVERLFRQGREMERARVESEKAAKQLAAGEEPQIVTIKRVMEPNNAEPTVTITLKGQSPAEDKVLFTLVNGQTKESNSLQVTETHQQNTTVSAKKKKVKAGGAGSDSSQSPGQKCQQVGSPKQSQQSQQSQRQQQSQVQRLGQTKLNANKKLYQQADKDKNEKQIDEKKNSTQQQLSNIKVSKTKKGKKQQENKENVLEQQNIANQSKNQQQQKETNNKKQNGKTAPLPPSPITQKQQQQLQQRGNNAAKEVVSGKKNKSSPPQEKNSQLSVQKDQKGRSMGTTSNGKKSCKNEASEKSQKKAQRQAAANLVSKAPGIITIPRVSLSKSSLSVDSTVTKPQQSSPSQPQATGSYVSERITTTLSNQFKDIGVNSKIDIENLKLPPGITITKVDAPVKPLPIRSAPMPKQTPVNPPKQTTIIAAPMSGVQSSYATPQAGGNVIVVDTGKLKQDLLPRTAAEKEFGTREVNGNRNCTNSGADITKSDVNESSIVPTGLTTGGKKKKKKNKNTVSNGGSSAGTATGTPTKKVTMTATTMGNAMGPGTMNGKSSLNGAIGFPTGVTMDKCSADQPTDEPARILHNPGTNMVTIRNPAFGPMKVPPTQQAAIIKVSENGMVTIRSPALQQAINAGLTSPPKPDYIIKGASGNGNGGSRPPGRSGRTSGCVGSVDDDGSVPGGNNGSEISPMSPLPSLSAMVCQSLKSNSGEISIALSSNPGVDSSPGMTNGGSVFSPTKPSSMDLRSNASVESGMASASMRIGTRTNYGSTTNGSSSAAAAAAAVSAAVNASSPTGKLVDYVSLTGLANIQISKVTSGQSIPENGFNLKGTSVTLTKVRPAESPTSNAVQAQCTKAVITEAINAQIAAASSTNGNKSSKKKKKRGNGSKHGGDDWNLVESVFTPKDIDLEDGEMDDAERELEAFKRFCLQSVPPPRKEKVNLNIKDIVLKKKSSSSSNSSSPPAATVIAAN